MLTGAIASFLTSASPIHNPVLSAFGAMKGYPSSILLVTSVAAAISGQVGISEAPAPASEPDLAALQKENAALKAKLAAIEKALQGDE